MAFSRDMRRCGDPTREGRPCQQPAVTGGDKCRLHAEDWPGRCTKNTKKNGDRCRHDAIPGGTICRLHGGGAPQVRAAAQRNIAQQEAQKVLLKLGFVIDPANVDPTAELLRQIGLFAAQRDYLATVGADKPLLEDGAPHPLWGMYQQVAAQLVQAATSAIRAGIAERQVRLAEQQGALVADVIRRVFDDATLGLTDVQKEAARRAAARHLRAIA